MVGRQGERLGELGLSFRLSAATGEGRSKGGMQAPVRCFRIVSCAQERFGLGRLAHVQREETAFQGKAAVRGPGFGRGLDDRQGVGLGAAGP